MIACECDPLTPEAPVVTNPPGQPALRWRVAPHSASLARMRALLAAEVQPLVQALARHGSDDPAVALLDTWAMVADIVSFYTERIAQEGFLRTATELASVRELARTLGYELRPGVAAAVDLSFTLEAGAETIIAAGTPVRTVPGQGQQPQTFETSRDLPARGSWNAIPGVDGQPQTYTSSDPLVWLRGTGLGVRSGDPLLIVGAQRLKLGPKGPDHDDHWDLRVVDSVTENPDGLTGWTQLKAPSLRNRPDLGAVADATVFTFAERVNVFGWNAPDPALLKAPGGGAFPETDEAGGWLKFGIDATGTVVELDGDHPRVTGCSWIVLQAPGRTELYQAVRVEPSGAIRYALSGRITRVTPDTGYRLSDFPRRETVVLCQSRPLPGATEAPRRAGVAGAALELVPTDPVLPSGRRVLVTGSLVRAGRVVPVYEPATVLTAVATARVMSVILDHPLPDPIDPQTLRVLGNITPATHGETVEQVLGSGDGRVPFAQFQPRRGPLTYVGAANPSGAASTLQVRVDGVAWTEVASLATAAGHDRAYVVEHHEDGAVRVVIGDGTHGARAPTGADNVTGSYRVGIGADGAATAGQLSQLPHRPLGVRTVTNPGPARDWAAPETLQDARRNAPLRIRTLDRVVSVADHGDFAAAFAGVGAASADEVWDGRTSNVVVSLLGAAGTPASGAVLANLRAALAAASEPGVPLSVLGGRLVWFGVRVEVRTDPAYQRPAVEQAVRDALATRLAPAAGAFAAPVTAARVLVWVRAVPGVVACTMPRLLLLPDFVPSAAVGPPSLPGDDTAAEVLAALPARYQGGTVVAAELLALAPDGVAIGVMGP